MKVKIGMGSKKHISNEVIMQIRKSCKKERILEVMGEEIFNLQENTSGRHVNKMY